MTNNRPDIALRVQWEGLDALARALKAEADGKALRRDLAKNIRQGMQPAVAAAKSGIMAMGSTGAETSPALRPGIAKKIRAEVKLGGRWTGARIKARKTVGLREFANAPKRTQRAKGWRTKTYGREPWRVQHGKVGWFDDAVRPHLDEAKKGALDAMEAMAKRIADRGGA